MLVELGCRNELPAASALHFYGGVDHFLESVEELVILAVPRPFILLRLLFRVLLLLFLFLVVGANHTLAQLVRVFWSSRRIR